MKVNTNGKFYKWEVVLLLWVAFFLNQTDRQAFNIVLPQIQQHIGLSAGIASLSLIWIFSSIALLIARVCFYEKDAEKIAIK